MSPEIKDPYERHVDTDQIIASLHPRPDVTTYELGIAMQLTIKSLQLMLGNQTVTWQLFHGYPPEILRHFDFYNANRDFLTSLQLWAVEKSKQNIEEIQKTFQKLHTPHLSVD